jgi:hypothetical protein
MTHKREYDAWMLMKSRCSNPKNPKYIAYGARGITVSTEWINDFDLFFRDMGVKPTSKHSLERIDVNKGYTKGNCKWGTAEEQANNKRTSVKITYNGETLTVAQWQRKLNNPRIKHRLYAGWSVLAAFTTEKT